jgi:hypothetical protein
MEEILKLKTLVRLEKETVQQKEIEISRLHGQVFLWIFLYCGGAPPDCCKHVHCTLHKLPDRESNREPPRIEPGTPPPPPFPAHVAKDDFIEKQGLEKVLSRC